MAITNTIAEVTRRAIVDFLSLTNWDGRLEEGEFLSRLYDAVETGKIPLADLAPRIHDLRQRIEKLQERKVQITNQLSDRKVELASPEIVKSYVKDMRQVLEESELTGKRAFLKGFIKKIEVIDRQGIIHYLLSINGVLEERIGVLPIVQYSGRYCTIGRTKTFELMFSLGISTRFYSSYPLTFDIV